MKPILVVFSLLAAISLAGAQQELTKEGILRLKKSGANDAAILEAIKASGKKFDLSTDDVVALIAGGLSEEVVNAMLRAGRPLSADPPAKSAPEAERRTRLVAENKTSGILSVRIDPKRGEVLFASGRKKGMTEIPKGKSVEMEAAKGDYAVRWSGARVDLAFGIDEGKAVTLRIVEVEEDGCCSLKIQVVRDEKEKPAVPSADPQALYVCPMHPEITSKTQGTCSKCGMKLELQKPKAQEKKKDAHDHDHPK